MFHFWPSILFLDGWHSDLTGIQLPLEKVPVSLQPPDVIKLPGLVWLTQAAVWTRSWTHLGNDGQVLHTVPAWFIDISQGLGEALWCLMHSWGWEGVNTHVPKIDRKVGSLSAKIRRAAYWNRVIYSGAVAAATERRPEKHSVSCPRNTDKTENKTLFLHVTGICNAELAVCLHCSVGATQHNSRPDLQLAEISLPHYGHRPSSKVSFCNSSKTHLWLLRGRLWRL